MPIGSKFSMEQTIIQLSFVSRTTSISNSFHPSKDSSINNSLVGDNSSPRRQISTNSSRLYAIPPPDPPIVNDGRIIQGYPNKSGTLSASSRLCTISALAVSKPIFFIATAKRLLSSAFLIASWSAPIISTSNLSRTPSR